MAVKLSPPPQIPGIPDIWRRWFLSLFDRVGEGPLQIRAYTVADLPDATKWGDASTFTSLVFVTDAAGGACLGFSNGTNWKQAHSPATTIT